MICAVHLCTEWAPQPHRSQRLRHRWLPARSLVASLTERRFGKGVCRGALGTLISDGRHRNSPRVLMAVIRKKATLDLWRGNQRAVRTMKLFAPQYVASNQKKSETMQKVLLLKLMWMMILRYCHSDGFWLNFSKMTWKIMNHYLITNDLLIPSAISPR